MLYSFSKWHKSGHQPFKHVVYHETRYESYEKTNNQSQIDKHKEGKLDLYWLIVLVTMTTPTSSRVKDKNNIFTVRGEEKVFLVKGKIPVFQNRTT